VVSLALGRLLLAHGEGCVERRFRIVANVRLNWVQILFFIVQPHVVAELSHHEPVWGLVALQA